MYGLVNWCRVGLGALLRFEPIFCVVLFIGSKESLGPAFASRYRKIIRRCRRLCCGLHTWLWAQSRVLTKIFTLVVLWRVRTWAPRWLWSEVFRDGLESGACFWLIPLWLGMLFCC